MLALSITAQNLMVNIVAINAFVLIFCGKDLHFGKADWKLLLWTFGTPFLGATIAGVAGQLGPNGAFCYFDGIKGKITSICFTTVPLLIILLMNIVLYILTWQRIYVQSGRLKGVLGKKAKIVRKSHRVARTMSLFVTAFFVQWWAMALYGIWQLVDEDFVPLALFQFVTTFSNVGGILNGIVYIIIRKKKLGISGKSNESTLKTNEKNTNSTGQMLNQLSI